MTKSNPKYTLAVFANRYPRYDGDFSNIFIKKMVDGLIDEGVDVRLAVKYTPSILGYPRFFLDSLRLCMEKDIDILQAHYIPHSSIIPALFKGKRPLIVKFHGSDANMSIKGPLHRAVIRWMIRRSDHVLAVSEEIRQSLINIGADPNHTTTIASGVDTTLFRPMTQSECRDHHHIEHNRIVFLFVGRYHPWKGISELIEAAQAFPDDLFIFAGNGHFPDTPENCKNLGSVPPSDMPQLMNAADCLVLPTYHPEGVPNVLMEALSCSTPVIATDVGGCPEVVKDGQTGLIIPPKDVAALISAIRWMKEHPEERKAMGEAGRCDMIERYELKTMIQKTIEVHREVLEKYIVK